MANSKKHRLTPVLSILLALSVILSMCIPFSALASEINTIQTAESISVGQSRTQTYTYGYPNGRNSDFITDSAKYYKVTIPSTGYYEFQVTGFENSKYYGTHTSSAACYIYDSTGKYLTSAHVNEYTNICKKAVQLAIGQTYYIEVDSDVSSIASYHDYDYGYATESLTLAVRNHTHTMKPTYYSTITYYDCEYCDYSYYISNSCQHRHTKKTVTRNATYWSNGSYNVYCTDCGNTISTNHLIAKRAIKLSSVKSGKRKATVKWNKASGAKGYQIQYSTKKNMKGAKTTKVKNGSSTSKTIKKLKKGKRYYFRVRAYKGKNTSSWSSKKSVKIK